MTNKPARQLNVPDPIIDLRNKHEILFWCKMLGCTKRALIKAVLETGSSPKDIFKYLEITRH